MGNFQYRLRAAAPMPTQQLGSFVLHSFMAAKSETIPELCIKDLPSSSSFQGQGADLTSANYSSLPLKGGEYFRGQKSIKETYVEENSFDGFSGSVAFIEAGSANVSYSVMGIAQVNYVLVTDSNNFETTRNLVLGTNTFNGHVMTASIQLIPGSEKSDAGGWYTTNISMVTVKE